MMRSLGISSQSNLNCEGLQCKLGWEASGSKYRAIHSELGDLCHEMETLHLSRRLPCYLYCVVFRGQLSLTIKLFDGVVECGPVSSFLWQGIDAHSRKVSHHCDNKNNNPRYAIILLSCLFVRPSVDFPSMRYLMPSGEFSALSDRHVAFYCNDGLRISSSPAGKLTR